MSRRRTCGRPSAAVALLLALSACGAGQAASDEAPRGIAGSWEGEAETEDRPTFLRLDFTSDPAGWSGTLAALGNSFEFEEVAVAGAEVRAVLVPGEEGFAIEGVLERDQITGAVVEAGERYPLTLLRIPAYPEPQDRIQGWRQDLDALATRFARWDRSFPPRDRAEFERRLRALRDEVPTLHDDEVLMRIASAVALSGNAHTRLYLLRNRTALRRLPVRVWWFADELRVVRATEAHAALVGCRVEAIGGHPALIVRDSVARAFAGNQSWTRYKSVYYMTSPEVLHGFGLVPSSDEVTLRLADCDGGAGEHTLEPLPLAPSADPVEAWWDLSPAHAVPGWTAPPQPPSAPTPLYLSAPDRHYGAAYLEADDLLYLWYSRSTEMEDPSVGEFQKELHRLLDEHSPATLVVDLRFNTGGDMGLANPLMTDLEARTRGLRRYVVTGRATFSAGLAHAARWAEAEGVTVLGEQAGDALDFWAEGGNVTLPWSGLDAHFANGFHSYSTAPCPARTPCVLDLSVASLEPALHVETTWADYVTGVDPVLSAIRTR